MEGLGVTKWSVDRYLEEWRVLVKRNEESNPKGKALCLNDAFSLGGFVGY